MTSRLRIVLAEGDGPKKERHQRPLIEPAEARFHMKPFPMTNL